jgi:hypothetical protein
MTVKSLRLPWPGGFQLSPVPWQERHGLAKEARVAGYEQLKY